MAENYFSKFPTLVYNGVVVKDISRRAVISSETRSVPTVFYPYEVQAGLRSDTIADAYYDDPTYDWLIYLTNGIVDPYYGWYLDEYNFNKFIADKYGSQEKAIKTIKYYQLNWSDDDVDLDPSYYDNNLPEVLKKYFSPNFGYSSRVISYRRRREDWTVNTNKIYNFNVAMASNTLFETGELVKIQTLGLDVGNCQVVFANSTLVTVNNISGNTDANNQLVSDYGTATATITDTDLVIENITDDEAVFWSGISYFEYERAKNEDRKFVTLLDANYALEAAENLRKKMKE